MKVFEEMITKIQDDVRTNGSKMESELFYIDTHISSLKDCLKLKESNNNSEALEEAKNLLNNKETVYKYYKYISSEYKDVEESQTCGELHEEEACFPKHHITSKFRTSGRCLLFLYAHSNTILNFCHSKYIALCLVCVISC